jgi:hypothetical protein
MPSIINQRMCAEIEGDFVVFMIGMRINNLFMIHKWLPMMGAMPKMLKELGAHAESGFLGVQSAGTALIQYWRSFEHLEAYARSKDMTHFPEWVKFNKRIAGNTAVGIWHETYLVRSGEYETIYHNVPPRGLGKFTKLVPASGRRETAKGRLNRNP